MLETIFNLPWYLGYFIVLGMLTFIAGIICVVIKIVEKLKHDIEEKVMEDIRKKAEMDYKKAKAEFVSTCKECYANEKFMKASSKGLEIPKLCKNCNDRLKFEETVYYCNNIIKRGRGR